MQPGPAGGRAPVHAPPKLSILADVCGCLVLLLLVHRPASPRPAPRSKLIAQEKTARILYLSVTHRTSRSFLIEQEKLLVALHVQLRHSKRCRSQHIPPSGRTAAHHSTRKPFCSKLTSYVSGPWAGGIASSPCKP